LSFHYSSNNATKQSKEFEDKHYGFVRHLQENGHASCIIADFTIELISYITSYLI